MGFPLEIVKKSEESVHFKEWRVLRTYLYSKSGSSEMSMHRALNMLSPLLFLLEDDFTAFLRGVEDPHPLFPLEIEK